MKSIRSGAGSAGAGAKTDRNGPALEQVSAGNLLIAGTRANIAILTILWRLLTIWMQDTL